MALTSIRTSMLAWLAALAASAAPGWADDLPAQDSGRSGLAEALDRYRALEAGGGWIQTPPGPALEIGDSGPPVIALRKRLAVEGFACGVADEPAAFDPTLDCAVRQFQRQRGLEIDGVVGPATRAELNVPAPDRVRQISVSLDREEGRLPNSAPDRIEVNIAAAEATLFRAGAPVLTTRIIAGKPATPTPRFEAEVVGVIVNPAWNVPDSIARNEILPRAAREPGYLAEHHFVQQGGRLVQAPGADNSLGRIKLDMPNPHTVYLHDTPARALFETARRYYSHGCMRMQHAREMAAALLQDQGWTLETIDAAIALGETRTIPLSAPTPVQVYYQTAYISSDGVLILQPDIYGLDRLSEEEAAVGTAEAECGAPG